MQSTQPKNFLHRTNTGRVVYDRKKHYFTLKRVAAILISLTTTMDPHAIEHEAVAARAVYEVAKHGFYNQVRPLFFPPPKPVTQKELYLALREIWKRKTLEILDDILKYLNLGSEWAEPLASWLFDFLDETFYYKEE